jgi:hypothetical protein
MVYTDIIPQCPEVKKIKKIFNNITLSIDNISKVKKVKNINEDVYDFRPKNKKNIYMYDGGNIIYIGKLTGTYAIRHDGVSTGICNLQKNDNIKIWIKGNYIRELNDGYIFEGEIKKYN